MRKKDLLWEFWTDLCVAYRKATTGLVKVIQAAKTADAGVNALNQYNAIHLDFGRSLVFATGDQLRKTFKTLLESLENLGYVEMPTMDERVKQFLEGEAGRPFAETEE